MNHRPTCTECKSESLENAGSPISAGGKVWYPRRCQKCGHFWSEDKPLTLPPPAPKSSAPAPVVGLPAEPVINAVPPAAPAPAEAPAPAAPAAPEPPAAPAAPVPAAPEPPKPWRKKSRK